jgi:hypothetical protein
MRVNSSIRFVLQAILLGLLAAAIILLIWPGLSGRSQGGYASSQAVTGTYSTAVGQTAPAVVNVYASKVLQQQVNPLFQDPLFQRFFDLPQPSPTSAGTAILDRGSS